MTNAAEPPGAKCPEGGTKFTVGAAAPTYACDGVEGEVGEPGEPWTAGGTLPPGETETGAWAFSTTDEEAEIVVPISFPIPLPAELFEEHVHFQNLPTEEAFAEACPGGVIVGPKAEPGELCVYYSTFGFAPVNATFTRISPLFQPEESGASTAGAVIRFAFGPEEGEPAYGSGAWAVTAPEP